MKFRFRDQRESGQIIYMLVEHPQKVAATGLPGLYIKNSSNKSSVREGLEWAAGVVLELHDYG